MKPSAWQFVNARANTLLRPRLHLTHCSPMRLACIGRAPCERGPCPRLKEERDFRARTERRTRRASGTPPSERFYRQHSVRRRWSARRRGRRLPAAGARGRECGARGLPARRRERAPRSLPARRRGEREGLLRRNDAPRGACRAGRCRASAARRRLAGLQGAQTAGGHRAGQLRRGSGGRARCQPRPAAAAPVKVWQRPPRPPSPSRWGAEQLTAGGGCVCVWGGCGGPETGVNRSPVNRRPGGRC